MEHTRIRLWAVIVWLILWQVGSMVLDTAILLPSPLSALGSLLRLAGTPTFWRTVGWSAWRIFGGFFAAVVAASLLAAAAYRFALLRELLSPVVLVMKAVPVTSFIILALVWLNSRSLPAFIAALMVFPPVYLGVLTGIGQTDRKLLELARVYRVPFLRQVKALYLPAIAPHFRSAVSLGLGLCWKAGVAAEVIGLPNGSVGERLYMAKVYFETPELFAWTAVIAVLSAVTEKLILRGLDAVLERMGAIDAA